MSNQTTNPVEAPSSNGKAPSVGDQLATLRTDLDHLKTESKSWVKTWGIYLGMLGALISVPKGALDLVTQLWHRPDTSVTIKNIAMTHVPGLSSEILEFPLVVMNLGNRDDAFLNRGATLTGGGKSVELSADDFGLYDNGQKIETPLLVPKDALRAYVVSVTFNPNALAVAATPGLHTLELRFRGVNESYSATVCFSLQQSDVDVLFKSDQIQSRTPISRCPGTG